MVGLALLTTCQVTFERGDYDALLNIWQAILRSNILIRFQTYERVFNEPLEEPIFFLLMNDVGR